MQSKSSTYESNPKDYYIVLEAEQVLEVMGSYVQVVD